MEKEIQLKKLTILEGDFEATDWDIDSYEISKGFFSKQKIPYSEIVDVTTQEKIKNKHYVTVKTSKDNEFKASMTDNAYKVFYENYLKHGNKPKNVALPVEEKDKLLIGGAIVIGIIILVSNLNNNNQKKLSDEDAKTLCANYIGKIFGHSPSIISTELLKKDGGFFIKASYRRSSDNSMWDNVCHISGDTITWAGLNNGEPGRWRYEDDATIYYSSDLKTFKIRY